MYAFQIGTFIDSQKVKKLQHTNEWTQKTSFIGTRSDIKSRIKSLAGVDVLITYYDDVFLYNHCILPFKIKFIMLKRLLTDVCYIRYLSLANDRLVLRDENWLAKHSNIRHDDRTVYDTVKSNKWEGKLSPANEIVYEIPMVEFLQQYNQLVLV